MTTKTWLGGGNNRASRAADWSPRGAPQPGDTLILPPGSTIAVQGADLAGDALTIPAEAASSTFTKEPSINLSLSNGAAVTLNALDPNVTAANIAVSGADTLNLTVQAGHVGHAEVAMPTTVTLADNASLFGTFVVNSGQFTMNGGAGASYTNNGVDQFNGDVATINTDVLGSGIIVAGASAFNGVLTFTGSVASGQVVEALGRYSPYVHTYATATIDIASPATFLGTAEILSAGRVLLEGLHGASSWNFANDILTVKNAAGAVIDRTTLISNSDLVGGAHGLSVQYTSGTGDLLLQAGTQFHGAL